MSEGSEGLQERLAALRRSFDESFAAPSAADEVAPEDMLAIDVGGGRFAVRVSELGGVHACRRIVPLPGAPPGLAGLCGIRGRLVAAYRLSDIIAEGTRDQQDRPRWLLVCAGDSQVGLLIEGLSAYVRAAASDLYPARSGEIVSEHVRELVVHDGAPRGVLSIPSVLTAILRRASAATPGEGVSNG